MKQYILYDPLVGGGQGERLVRSAPVLRLDQTDAVLCDLTKHGDYAEFFAALAPDDRVVLCGGDATLSHFVNDTRGVTLPEELYYFACGADSDLMRDLGLQAGSSIVRLGGLLEGLPTLSHGRHECRFVNSAGLGLDGGYRARFALGGFRPCNAVVTVDGAAHSFERVWLASTLKGRYCGGMMVAPAQDRAEAQRRVSVLVLHGGRFSVQRTLHRLSRGTRTRCGGCVERLCGQDILVELDRPVPLYVDGEAQGESRVYRVRTGVE